MRVILNGIKDVQPLFVQRATVQKLIILKSETEKAEERKYA